MLASNDFYLLLFNPHIVLIDFLINAEYYCFSFLFNSIKNANNKNVYYKNVYYTVPVE